MPISNRMKTYTLFPKISMKRLMKTVPIKKKPRMKIAREAFYSSEKLSCGH
jgi:hypothetical protein